MAAHSISQENTALTQPGVATTGTTTNGRNRRRASLACLNCRKRKIKCHQSLEVPSSCTSCHSLQIPCVISKDGDRRKTGSRQQVAALQDRVQYLESLISQRQHDPVRRGSLDPAPMHKSFSAIEAVGSAELPVDPILSQTPSSSGGLHPRAIYGTIREPVLESGGRPFSDSGRILSPDSRQDINENLARQVDGRVGDRLQPNTGRLTPLSEKDMRLDIDENQGRPRFYGPTSQLHIQRRSTSLANAASATSNEPTEELKMDSAPLRALLFQIYWKIQPNSVIVVDETLFQAGRTAATRSEFYSEFLENCLMACATRVSTSEGVRALGPKFVERAKVDIVQELEYPNIATLQGFLLLSDFEATRGRDRLGYTYCGISCRLAFDLGLPENCDKLVDQGKLTTSEALSRHTLLLVTFVFDKLWGLYLGRPSAIPIDMLEVSHDRSLQSGWSGPPTLTPWVGLCADMSDITDILNRSSPLDDRARERLNDLDANIARRHEALPYSLQLRDDQVTELPVYAYSLHIQFCGLRIVLHRILSKAAFQGGPGSSAEESNSPESKSEELSRSIMYENAKRIARLVSAYQQIFGIENVITVMLDNMYVAATVLISHLLRLTPDDASAAARRDFQWLQTLAELLLKAQKHYPVTVRMRSTLSSLVENTGLAGIFGTFASAVGTPTNALGNLDRTEGAPSGSNISDWNRGLTIPSDFFADNEDRLLQDMNMDLSNNLSWLLSPTNEEVDPLFQV